MYSPILFIYGILFRWRGCLAAPDRDLGILKKLDDGMETVVQLRSDIAELMSGGAETEAGTDQLNRIKTDLENKLVGLGVSLRAIHPGVEDKDLARYFTLSEASRLEDKEIYGALRELENLEAVTAAYAKPDAELA